MNIILFIVNNNNVLMNKSLYHKMANCINYAYSIHSKKYVSILLYVEMDIWNYTL